MITIEKDFSKTGWTIFPGDAETIVAYFKDGHKETMEFFEYALLSKKKAAMVVKVDCYCKGEKIQEE